MKDLSQHTQLSPDQMSKQLEALLNMAGRYVTKRVTTPYLTTRRSLSLLFTLRYVPRISTNRWVAIVLYQFRTMNDECGLYFAKRITYKLTRGKQNTCLTRRSLDETIATIDRWLKMTGCRIVECKQIRTNDKKSINPLPHNKEKSIALVYSKS